MEILIFAASSCLMIILTSVWCYVLVFDSEIPKLYLFMCAIILGVLWSKLAQWMPIVASI